MWRLWMVLTVSLCSCAEPNCRMVQRPAPKPAPELDLLAKTEPVPRCSAEDARCGPEPLRREEPVCYKPAAARERLPPDAEPPEPSERRYRCSHDGECQIAGCGNVCVLYPLAGIETNCHGYSWLDDRALCGCVEGACSFFRQ